MKKTFIRCLIIPIIIAGLAACNQRAGTEKETDSGGTTAANAGFRAINSRESKVYSAAFNAVTWGMPAVNFELLYQSMARAKGQWNQIVYWSDLPSWKNQTLTPNPDVIYLFPIYNTTDGPVVMEIPPADGTNSITGSIDDGWQTALEDVGPAGVDKGKGGKYLILPPGYKGKVPSGYIPLQSAIFTGYGAHRSNIGNGSRTDIAKAVQYGKRIKIYPLADASNPPATRFVDVKDVVYDNIIPYGLHFFELLHNFVQREPWLERDKVMIDMLKTIGIEKGKPFNPDARTKEILNAAISDAHNLLEADYEKLFAAPFFENTHWCFPGSKEVVEGLQTNFANPDSYPVDARGLTYFFAYFSPKHLGAGQYYLLAITDKDSKPLDGGKTYQLHIPPNPPVRLYWSATIYNRATHTLIRDKNVFSRASNSQGLQKNTDGSVDIYFGPQAPEGKESNWVPTDAKGQFEVLFRFYGPEKALFDKTWKLPDIEKQ